MRAPKNARYPSSYVRVIFNLFQGHICGFSMVGHLDPAGLSCLSDGQILPILLHMDTDTLLNVSRSSIVILSHNSV